MTRNWELNVQFKVHGKGKELYGDGMAIWYAKDRMQQGPVFGNKDYFSGLAIILDTYSNHNGPHNVRVVTAHNFRSNQIIIKCSIVKQHQHPYISAMVNNGSLSYDHDRDGTHTQLAGCEAKFRNLDYDTYLSIKYENDVLTVATDVENKNQWKQCFSAAGVRLPTGYYFGISAETGDLSDNHDMFTYKFYEINPTDVIYIYLIDHFYLYLSYYLFLATRSDGPNACHSGGF